MCPVCGADLTAESASRCPHVVAWMGPSGFTSPLDGIALPWLAGPAARRRWPALTVAEAFGELAPLVDAYGAIADWRPGMSARVLWPLLTGYVDELIATVDVGEGQNAETYWCAHDPERVTRQAQAIAALLTQGYAYLSAQAARTDESRAARGRPAAAAVVPKVA